MRRRLGILIGATAAIVLATASAAPHASADVGARRVAGGLAQPVAFTFGPGKQLWYVEKGSGQIRIVDLDSGDDRLFATVGGVNAEGERGTLGIALHPDYPDEPFVYVYATRTDGGQLRNQILRYEDRDGSGAAETVLFSSPASSSPYHNGGRIAFGPDGMLYAIVGDGHAAANAQDRSNNDRGKIIRITPDGDVPGTNPFGDRIWAYGIRNSFGFAFDPETDALWETENGPACNDEMNRIRRGGNYGWGPSAGCEGASPGNTNRDGSNPIRPRSVYVDPIGITGIAFCDRCGLGGPSDGAAFHGSVNDGRVTRLVLNDRRTGIARRTVVYDHPSSTLSFEVGPRGRLYFSDFGAIYRLVRR
ncbi:MAG: PQQ-dependent sugar dehydrogenase [Actinomycetota bacterium]